MSERRYKFELGRLVQTPGMTDVAPLAIHRALVRHRCGDWGNISDGDKKLNNADLADGGRLLSSYNDPHTGTKFWIITEADRSSTCVLLPSEY